MSLRNLFGGGSKRDLTALPVRRFSQYILISYRVFRLDSLPVLLRLQKFHDFVAKDIRGRDVRIGDVAGGKVTLVVNTASKCGYTDVYRQLQSLYERFSSHGFVVLGKFMLQIALEA